MQKIVHSLLFLFVLQIVSAQQINNKNQISNLLKKAGTSFYNLEGEKSLTYAKEALNLSHEIDDDILMAKAYNIIGLNFQEFSEPKLSISYFKKGLEHANNTENDSIKLWLNNNIACVYNYNDIDSNLGIKHYEQALVYAKKIKDSSEINYNQLNICSAYFNSNQFEKGHPYLIAAKNYTLSKGDEEAKMSFYSKLGNYSKFLKDYNQSEVNYLKAIEIGKSVEVEMVNSVLSQIYNDISDLYKLKNEPKKQQLYLSLHNSLEQKLYNEDNSSKIKKVEKEIEIDEYKRQIDKIEDVNKSQSDQLSKSNYGILVLVLASLFLLILLFSLYKNNKFRKHLNEKLKLANIELQKAKEEAEEANKLKSQFVSTITHELRTPLYGVIGVTNIILDEHKELVNSPHINSLKYSAGYLLSLVNDLLQINKIEENRIQLESMIFSLQDEVKTIIDSLKFIAQKNNNKLTLELDSKIPETLIGDKLRLSQIFMNLISNALKFTKNGEVKIVATLEKIENTKSFILFKIVDNGVGIPKEFQHKIFEKFVQLNREKSDYQGTGLGLAIVKNLVEIFGGKIAFESEENKGTTFYFTLGFEASDEKKNEIINNIVVDLSDSYSYNVLVVEDNKINQIVTKKILDSNNFKSTLVDDGYSALDILENQEFDIILMDINMPLINGFETSKLIRKKGIETPIIALTAFDKMEVTEQALSSGINDIIIKPFEKTKLFKAINNLIDSK